MNVGTLTRLLLAAMLVSPCPPAFAGGTQAERPQFAPQQIDAFSKQVERELGQRSARIALISRVGLDRASLPEGIEFTHVGFAVYSSIRLADGRTVPGYAMYNLYQDSETQNSSYLKQDYPLDYYAAVYVLEAGVVIPIPDMQRRLLAVIFSDTYAELHNPRYSAISNPFTSDLQNCTEFVLDVINAAVYQTDDVRLIKANEAAYFAPQPVEVDGLSLFFASMFTPDIALSDHEGPVRTATFWSVARYMQQHGLADEVFVVGEDGARVE